MTQGLAHRVTVGIALAGALILAAACGNYHPHRVQFHFTPVPYTVVAEPCMFRYCSQLYALSASCDWYAADQVDLLIDEQEGVPFESWAEERGFEVLFVSTSAAIMATPLPSTVLLRVPPGSVQDAIPLVTKRPGVVAVSKNSTLWIPELVPEFITQCLRRLHQQTPTATP
jgi:hypothetical protein